MLESNLDRIMWGIGALLLGSALLPIMTTGMEDLFDIVIEELTNKITVPDGV